MSKKGRPEKEDAKLEIIYITNNLNSVNAVTIPNKMLTFSYKNSTPNVNLCAIKNY